MTDSKCPPPQRNNDHYFYMIHSCNSVPSSKLGITKNLSARISNINTGDPDKKYYKICAVNVDSRKKLLKIEKKCLLATSKFYYMSHIKSEVRHCIDEDDRDDLWNECWKILENENIEKIDVDQFKKDYKHPNKEEKNKDVMFHENLLEEIYEDKKFVKKIGYVQMLINMLDFFNKKKRRPVTTKGRPEKEIMLAKEFEKIRHKFKAAILSKDSVEFDILSQNNKAKLILNYSIISYVDEDQVFRQLSYLNKMDQKILRGTGKNYGSFFMCDYTNMLKPPRLYEIVNNEKNLDIIKGNRFLLHKFKNSVYNHILKNEDVFKSHLNNNVFLDFLKSLKENITIKNIINILKD